MMKVADGYCLEWLNRPFGNQVVGEDTLDDRGTPTT
jgi:hypothetical protein